MMCSPIGNDTTNQLGASTAVTRLVQDQAAPLTQLLQQTVVGQTPIRYAYGQERLASSTSDASHPREWYMHDGLGSLRYTTYDAGHVPQWHRYNYTPYGQGLDGIFDTFGFAGEYQDSFTGLSYNRARWYNPLHGAFLGRDPYAGDPMQPASLQPYQYGWDDPVLNTDPSGRCNPNLDDNCKPNGQSKLPPDLCQSLNICQNDTHECAGNPFTIEFRNPLAPEGSAPTCVDLHTLPVPPRLIPNKPSQLGIIKNPDGTITLCPNQSNTEDGGNEGPPDEENNIPPISSNRPPAFKPPTKSGAQQNANTAHEAFLELDQDLKDTTIAASRQKNGKPILALYNSTEQGTIDAVKDLRSKGWDVLPPPAVRTNEFHAERQLYYEGYTEIGISRQRGMCSECDAFFKAHTDAIVIAYR